MCIHLWPLPLLARLGLEAVARYFLHPQGVSKISKSLCFKKSIEVRKEISTTDTAHVMREIPSLGLPRGRLGEAGRV